MKRWLRGAAADAGIVTAGVLFAVALLIGRCAAKLDS